MPQDGPSLALGLKARPKALFHIGIGLGLPGGEDTGPQRAFGRDGTGGFPKQAPLHALAGRQMPAGMGATNRQQKIKTQK